MSKHTPGPWRYDYKPGYCGEIVSTDGTSVCSFTDEPTKDNARLIAAAPDLLSNLQFAVKLFEGIPALNATAQVEIMRDAIAKATEGQP